MLSQFFKRRMNYKLDLLLDIEKYVFTGTVVVTGELKKLNAKNLKIHNQKVEGNDVLLSSNVVHFDGVLNDQMVGFYRSQCSDKSYMFSTQMEAPYCRQVFPCVDEPSRKATFDISLIVPDHLEAISNMPVLKEEPFEGKLHEHQSFNPKHKLKKVTFEQTPLMSTYIVAFAVGTFYRTNSKINSSSGKGIDLSIITTDKSQLDSTLFAQEVATKCIHFFEDAFKEPYPLPKIDMLSVPSFAMGAMENWGLITYREKSLLYNPKTSDIHAKQWISGVICHELAHMWFGNLVTMNWWNDLWLNESFATYMGNLATGDQFPEWNIWTQFLADDFSRAMSLDALNSSHPIHVPIKTVEEIDSIFDAITYSKGASLIKMLVSFITPEVFLKGVQSYVQAFKYSNAKADDLWTHLSQSSQKDIKGFMHKWINQTGYPVISYSTKLTGNKVELHLEQNRFLELPKPSDQTWWIPLSITLCHKNKNSYKNVVFEQQKQSFVLQSDSPITAIYLNSHSDSFCKLNVPKEAYSTMNLLSDDGQYTLISNVTTNKSMEESVAILNQLDCVLHYVSVQEICQLMDKWYNLYPKKHAALDKLLIKVLEPTYKALTDEPKDLLTKPLVMQYMGMANYEPVVKECHALYKSTIPAALWTTVYGVLLRQDASMYDYVLKEYKDAKNIDYKYACLSALPLSEKVDDLLKNCLDSEVIKNQDVHYVFRRISKNYNKYNLAWTFIISNWKAFNEKYKECPDYLGGLVKNSLQYSSNTLAIKEMEDVCTGEQFSRKVAETKEMILINAASIEKSHW